MGCEGKGTAFVKERGPSLSAHILSPGVICSQERVLLPDMLEEKCSPLNRFPVFTTSVRSSFLHSNPENLGVRRGMAVFLRSLRVARRSVWRFLQGSGRYLPTASEFSLVEPSS